MKMSNTAKRTIVSTNLHVENGTCLVHADNHDITTPEQPLDESNRFDVKEIRVFFRSMSVLVHTTI